MSKKHRAIKATLDVGTAAEWNADHISDYETTMDHARFFMGIVVTVEWELGQVAGTGVAPINTFVDHHASCKLDSGAGANDVSSMRHRFNGAVGDITHSSNAPIHTTRVWLDSFPATTNCAEWGFFEDTGIPFAANQHGAYFEVDTNVLNAVTGDGAAETKTDITPAGGIPEYAHYRIELTGSNCLFFVDDMETPAATHTANLPTNDLTLKYSCKNIGGGAGTQVEMYVDASALKRNVYTG